jgi:tryptophan 7-halogenase
MPSLSATEAAQAILHFADGLPGPYGYEPSIKFIGGQVLSHRFLITFPKIALEMGADLTGLLQVLVFPVADHGRLQALLDAGDVIHLGFEQEPAGFVCKLYVEASRRTRELWELKSLPDLEPVSVHKAIKWRKGADQCIETAYDWLPCSSTDLLIQQISVLSGGVLGGEACIGALTQLLALATGNAPVSDLQLMSVSESHGPRRSFDLNLYDSGLLVSDSIPLLVDIFVDLAGLHVLTNGDIKGQALGHIAGGMGRDGTTFLTVYYGAEERGAF